MVYIRKKIVAIALMFLSVLTLLAGCDDNKYKDLKLEVEKSEIEIVLDDENPQNNVFGVSAIVSGMPKGYDGSVSFSIPVNDFIKVVDDTPEVDDGVSTAVFEAKKQGGPINITIRTTEGNLEKQVKVKVVKPITSISFNQQIIPIVKGQRVDISQFLVFNPQGTAQDGIKLELSAASSSENLIRIVTDGKYLTVPNDLIISDFNIRARSTVNESIVSNTALAKVVNIVPVENIKLMNNNGTVDSTEDDVQVDKLSNGEYNIVLATNASDSFSKGLYFNFNDRAEENANYIVSVTGLTTSGAIVKPDGVTDNVVEIENIIDQQNAFSVNAIGNGATRIEFVIKRADFPNFEAFTQKIVLNVKVEAFPTEIKVTNGVTENDLEEIRLYANYNEAANVFGTRFRIKVLNETGEMTNQKVKVTVNLGEQNIVLYDRFRTIVGLGEETYAGYDYYLSHTFVSIPSEKIVLTITSVTYDKVFLSVPITIETAPLVLSTSKPTVYVDVTKPEALTSLSIEGVSASYDLSTLTVDLLKNDLTDASKLIVVNQSKNQITIQPIGDIGECYIAVTAENGSQITFKVILFESLSTENSYVTIAGSQILAKEYLGGIPRSISVKNGLTVPIYFTINGKNLNRLDGTGLRYDIESSNTSVIKVPNGYQLQAQNMPGDSTITITVVGFNEFGEQTKTIYFSIKIQVTIPLTTLGSNSLEVKMYDTASLNASQIPQYGQHEILLSAAPSNASFTHEDIEWVYESGDIIIDSSNRNYSKSVSNGVVIITIRPVGGIVITITTSTTSFKAATVSCAINSGTIDRHVFTIKAKVDQEFYNENGVLIPAPKESKTRFIVTKAERVRDFLFTNLPGYSINGETYYELVFDERDLGYTGVEYTQNNVKEIAFTVYPATALNKLLQASSNNSSVQARVIENNTKIEIKLISNINSSSEDTIVTVTSLDTGAKKEIKIRVLDGTEVSPFEIKNADDLKAINSSLNAHYVLANDVYIPQSSGPWLPIGYSYSESGDETTLNLKQFNGKLTGKYDVVYQGKVLKTNYYSINGFRIANSDLDYYGLFAYLGTRSVVRDLVINDILIDVTIVERSSNIFVGGLAGYSDGAISNVTINDGSGVANFDGTHYDNIKNGTIKNGIFVKYEKQENTTSTERGYYFVGGLVGFANNALLNTDTGTNVSGMVVETESNNVANIDKNFPALTLKVLQDKPIIDNYCNTGEIVNSTAAIQINTYVETHNVEYVGGLVGFSNRVIIKNNENNTNLATANSANVIAVINANVDSSQQIHNTNSAFGGVVGFNNGNVSNISAKTSIFGEYSDTSEQFFMSNIGGIAGYNVGLIENTEAYPLLRGYLNIGGVAGRSETGVVYISNTVNDKYYSFVNGIYPADDVLFTLPQSLDFNRKFAISFTRFESQTFTYNEFLQTIGKDMYENAVKTLMQEAFGLNVDDLNTEEPMRTDLVFIKVTKNDLITNNTIVNYTAAGKGNFDDGSFYKSMTSNDIASAMVSYRSNIIRNNRVKFLQLDDEVLEYNTAIIGFDNVGGVVGSFSSVVAVGDTVAYYPKDTNSLEVVRTNDYTIYNPLEFNSVYNYSNLDIRPYNELGYTTGFYGNIMLADSHTQGSALENRNYAGGIVGRLNNGAVTNSQVNAIMQGKLSGIGGIVGKAEGVIKVDDSLFIGTIHNKIDASEPTVTSASGGIVGDALNATTTFAYLGERVSELVGGSNQLVDKFRYVPSELNIKSTYGSLATGYNNISNSYYIAKTLTGYIVSTQAETEHNKSLGFVGEGTKVINIPYIYLSSPSTIAKVDYGIVGDPKLHIETATDILKVNQSKLMKNADNTNDSDDPSREDEIKEYSAVFTQNVLQTNNAEASDPVKKEHASLTRFVSQAGIYQIPNEYETGVKVDSNGDGLKDSETGNDYSIPYDVFKTKLNNVVWYGNYQVNNGLPVLLSQQKLKMTGDISYQVDLLASYPPVSINVGFVENYVDTFIASIDETKMSVVYTYNLSSSNYDSTGQKINFGTALTDSARDFYTSDLNTKIKELNMYSISEVLDVKTVPSFIDANNFIITSSNSKKLSIEYGVDNNVYFYAQEPGSVEITITSTYNKDCSKTVTVNVVNATKDMDLSYYSAGVKHDIENNDTIYLNKSSVQNQTYLSVSSALSANYNYVYGDRINKTFDFDNNASGGVRYYLLTAIGDGSEHSIMHATNSIDTYIESNNLRINNTNFSYEYIGECTLDSTDYSYYIMYIDVPAGAEAMFSGLEELEMELLAVPYVSAVNSEGVEARQSLLKIGDYYSSTTLNINTSNGVENEKVYGISSTSNEQLELLANVVKIFNVKVSRANWAITQSLNQVSFNVYDSPEFAIEIETDKESEDLFIVYYDEYNQEKVVAVSTVIDIVNYNFNSEIQIGNLTVQVNNIDKYESNGRKFITYNFELLSKPGYQINVQDPFLRTFTFFVAKQNCEAISISSNGFVTNVISNIMDNNMKCTLPVTLNPQEIKNISLKHYPNSESTTTIDANGNKITEVNLNEIAYDNVIPGHIGILKVYVSPYYASFDRLELISSGSGNDIVQFEQMLAVVQETEFGIIYTGKYQTLVVKNTAIANGVVLQKQSYITQDGKVVYDGNIYVRTLINSFVSEEDAFTLTVYAYKNGELKKNQSIYLTVQTPPSLILSVNGEDRAPIARGTEVVIDAKLNGVEGIIDFSSSYGYYLRNGREVRDLIFGTDFTITTQNGKYIVQTNVNLSTRYFINVVGVVTKKINGETITHTDSVLLKVTDFVINEITVENVRGGKISGYFNQPYSLVVRLSNVTYHELLQDSVKAQIKELERQFSQFDAKLHAPTVGGFESNPLVVWKTVNSYASGSSRYGTITMGSNPNNTFIISKKLEDTLENTLVYSIQNTKFGSNDILAACIQFVYTNEGIVPLMDTATQNEYSGNAFTFEKVCEFGFNFYRIRDEERPDPIETAEQFKNMEDGVDYILTSDITLTNWEPLREDLKINSLDGNGYVITIESFKLDNYTEDMALIENKNIGIFSRINAGTTIKNLIIEVKATATSANVEYSTYDSTYVDLLVDARAYKNVNFGLLAAENAGIVTNVQVVYDANQLRLDREMTIEKANTDSGYYVNGEFDEVKYLGTNFSKYFDSSKWIYDSSLSRHQVVPRSNASIRELSVVRVETTETLETQVHYIAGLIAKNLDEGTDSEGNNATGYITNSSIEDVTINGIGYVAGFVVENNGKISSSYFKDANIINRVAEDYAEAATSGFVIYNSGTNAAIQYSYVQGRIGCENNDNLLETFGDYKSANPDKTNLGSDIKQNFAGYKFALDSSAPKEKAALRALNSLITTKTEASAFVYENDALISNTYANIMVNSTMRTSGFVSYNKENGIINNSYTLSSVKVNDRDASPFTGRSETHTYNNLNPDGIYDVHYLKLGSDTKNCEEIEIKFAEDFLDENEYATALGASDFSEYNTFQGYAFNTDYAGNSKEGITRSVWFIPNNASVEHYTEFKGNHYIFRRPELVAANLKTISIRVWTGADSDGENSYKYVSEYIGEAINNPILIKTAEDFNKHLYYETNVSATERNFAIRFISDIAFNRTDLTAQTYNMEYYGDLDGNGMNINELRLVSDTDFETNTEGENTNSVAFENLGLFGKIISKPINSEYTQRGVVRNLNIDVSEVRGSEVPYVGVLAGTIENANIFNINISGDEIVQGRNAVGALAGIVLGDSEIINITSSLSAKAAYFDQTNRFSSSVDNLRLDPAAHGKFNLYYKVVDENGSSKVQNINTISYVGGIVGIFDVDSRNEGGVDPLSLFNARARKLTVSGDVTLIGEVVGGIIGLSGDDSTVSDIKFEINEGTTPELKASRAAGGLIGENRGKIERSYIAHETALQERIDEEYKRAVTTTSANPTVYNSSLNYSDLFKGNPHYIGGMIGFNNGGEIENCYSKVNVININSMYAGGIIGLSIGGTYNFCYTTGSVSAFYAVGGFTGIESVSPTDKTKDITSTEKYFYFNITGADAGGDSSDKNVTMNSTSKYNGVITINVWRKDDLNTDRAKKFNYSTASYLKIGAYAGLVYMPKQKLQGNNNENFSVNDIISVVELEARIGGSEMNFFNFVKLTGDNLPTEEFANYIPEIGALTEGDDENYTYVIEKNGEPIINNDYRYSKESYILQAGGGERIGESWSTPSKNSNENVTRYEGLSGYIEVQVENSDSTISLISYKYSRLQNIGSGRTLKEFIQKLDIIDADASLTGGLFEQNTSYAPTNVVTSPIYNSWDPNRWTGIKKETLADQATVFPYIQAKPVQTVIYVTKAVHLLQMSTYVNAEFVLMNDIDLLELGDDLDSSWIPAGTKALPFRGSLHSVDGEQYTIHNLKIITSAVPYVGLVGYATEAKFYNFNLRDVTINTTNENETSLFIGSLFGYSSVGTTVNNVNLLGASINPSYAGTVGGLVGYSGQGKITNCRVENLSINISKIGNTQTVTSDKDKLFAFGGVAGMITSLSVEEPLMQNISVKESSITFTDSAGESLIPDNITLGGDSGRSLDIGGIIGRANDAKSVASNVQGIYSDINFLLNFSFTKSDIGVQTINEMNVGGIIGRSNRAVITTLNSVKNVGGTEKAAKKVNYVAMNTCDGTFGHNINVSGLQGTLNYGGAVGNLIGNFSSALEIDEDTLKPDISYTMIGTQIKNAETIKVNTSNVGFENQTKQNIGGLVGKATNASLKDNTIFANIENNSSNANVVTNIGGIVGIAYDCQYIKNSATYGQLDTTINSDKADIYCGGAFGKVLMVNSDNGVGFISQIATSMKVKTTVEKETSIDVTHVGGFAGLIYNGKISYIAVFGDVTVVNANKSENLYVGGFVGTIDLNTSTVTESDTREIKNQVTIENSYSVSDLYVNGMFTNNNHKAGLFIGSINYGYYDIEKTLTLRNNYTIGKYIYIYGSTFDTVLYEEKINKGGFIGGYIFNVEGMNLHNIEKASNLLFINNYYNKDFVPYVNDIIEGKTTEEMLLNDKTVFEDEGSLRFNKDNVWTLESNKYPKLKWISAANGENAGFDLSELLIVSNAIDKTIGCLAVSSLQADSTKVSPLEITSMTGVTGGKTYLIKATSGNFNFTGSNLTIYVPKNCNVNIEIPALDKTSVLYGSNAGLNINVNDGLIVNAYAKGIVANNNKGVIYKTTIDKNNAGNLVTTNNGVIDSALFIDTTMKLQKLATEGSGTVYRVAIRNNVTKFDSANTMTIKSSYISSVEDSKINATYYDYDGNSSTLTDYSNNKFEVSMLNSSILNIDKFDFAHDWIFINSDDSILNYGAPILRYELYGDNGSRVNFDGDIKDEYMWASKLDLDDYASVKEFTDAIKTYENTNYVGISTPDELAKLALFATIGYSTSTEKSTVEFKTGGSLLTDNTNNRGDNLFDITEHKYGVKTTTSKYLYNFDNNYIFITTDISMKGKMWVPIGFGFEGDKIHITTSLNSSNIFGDGVNNPFEGIINGMGSRISDITSIGVNQNVGLFGVASSRAVEFATNILIENSDFVSVSINDGTSVAGSLAGRVVVVSSSYNRIFDQIATENANVYSTNIASGIVGEIVNGTLSANLGANTSARAIPVYMNYSYVNSDVFVEKGENNFASAFANMSNNTVYKFTENKTQLVTVKEMSGYISEMYIAGNLGYYTSSNSRYTQHIYAEDVENNAPVLDYPNYAGMFGNINISLVDKDGYESTISKSIYALGYQDSCMKKENNLTVSELQTVALPYFSWGSEWLRKNGINNNYPILNSKMSYWTLTENTELPTITGADYLVSNAKQLAWIAKEVNENYNDFNNLTIILEADIDLGEHIWSPIGYDLAPFKGTFNFAGHTISNIISMGVFVENNEEIESVNKRTGLSVKCITDKYVGLFGYADNATLTSYSLDASNNPIYSTGYVGTSADALATATYSLRGVNTVDKSILVSVGHLGGLVAYAKDSDINNVESNVTITATSDKTEFGVGGLIGTYENTKNKTIESLVNRSSINVSVENAGGILGQHLSNSSNVNTRLTIKKSRNIADVISKKNNVGGIVGKSESYITIDGIENWVDSYVSGEEELNTSTTPDNMGNIEGNNNVGGIIGLGKALQVENVTNSGSVSGNSIVSGIVGFIDNNKYVENTIYETINIGKITGESFVGSLLGNAVNVDEYLKIVNGLNKGEISATGDGGSGLFLGVTTKIDSLKSVYSLVDTSTNVGNVTATATDEKITAFDKLGVINMFTLKKVESSNSGLYANTDITYDNETYIKFKDVFDQSLLWSGVKPSASVDEIKLDYRITPGGKAPENYVVSETDHLTYLTELNRKRYGVSCIPSNKSITLKNDLYIENHISLGFGAYPWRNNFVGNSKNLIVSSVSADSPTPSLFGGVFTTTSVSITDLYITYNPTEISNSGLVLFVGNNVVLRNINIKSNGKTINTFGDFGTIAKDLIGSTLTNCSNEQSITTADSSNVGGLAGNISTTTFNSCSNTGNITANNDNVKNVGGLVGTAKNISLDKTYKITGCSNISDINCVAGGDNIGGIVGYTENYNIVSNKTGRADMDGSILDKRVGTVYGNNSDSNVGGIVGYSKTSQHSATKNSTMESASRIKGYQAGGLIGKTDNDTFGSVGLVNKSLVRGYIVGGIAGYATGNKELNGATNDGLGEIISSSGYAGGIYGIAELSIIKNVTNKGFVADDSKSMSAKGVGGIVGSGTKVTISDCKVMGYVGILSYTNEKKGEDPNAYYGEVNFYYRDYNLDNAGESAKYYGTYWKNDKGSVIPTSGYVDKASSGTDGTQLRYEQDPYPYSIVCGTQTGSSFSGNTTKVEGDLTTVTVYDYYTWIKTTYHNTVGFGYYRINGESYYDKWALNKEHEGLEHSHTVVDDEDESSKYFGWVYGWGSSWSHVSIDIDLVPTETSVIEANGNTPRYDITYDPTPAVGEKVTTTRYEGETVKVPYYRRENYALAGWYDGDTYVTAANGTFVVTKDMTLTAKWEENSYNIELRDSDMVASVSEEDTYEFPIIGEPIMVKHNKPIGQDVLNEGNMNPDKENYVFNSWYKMSVDTWNRYAALLNAEAPKMTDVEEYNAFVATVNEINTYGFNFDPDDDFDDPGYRLLPIDEANKYNIENDKNYADPNKGFIRLKVDANSKFTSEGSIYALWYEAVYMYFHYCNTTDSQPETIDQIKIKKGSETVSIDEPYRENYIFKGWYDDALYTNEHTFGKIINDDIDLYAKWKGEDRQIQLRIESDLIENVTLTVEYGKTLNQCYLEGMIDKDYTSSSVVKKTGYTFDGWTYNGEEYSFDTPISDSITITAKFVPNSYNVFYYDEATADKTDYLSYETVLFGETTTKYLTAVENPSMEGYNFVGWYTSVDGGLTELEEFKPGETEIMGNTYVYAKWEPIMYSITYRFMEKVYTESGDLEEIQEVGSQVIEYAHGTVVSQPTEYELIIDGYKIISFKRNDELTNDYMFGFNIEGHDTVYVEVVEQIDVTFVIDAKYTGSSTRTTVVTVDKYSNVKSSDIPSLSGLAGNTNYSWRIYDTSTNNVTNTVIPNITTYKITEPITIAYHVEVAVNMVYDDPDDGLDTFVTFVPSTGVPMSYTLAYGDTFGEPATAPKLTGYQFVGYYSDSEFNTEYVFDTEIVADTSVYLKFIKIHTVTFRIDSSEPVTAKVSDGGYISSADVPSFTPVEGRTYEWHIADESGNSTGVVFDIYSEAITSDITIRLVYDINITLMTKKNEASWTEYKVVKVKSYTVLELTDLALDGDVANGYAGCFTDESGYTAFTFGNVIVADTTIYIKYTA